MAKDKILKQKVYHNGTSMVVLNMDDKHAVPDHLRQTFIDEGVIEGKTSDELAREAAAAAADAEDDDDAPLFTAKHTGFGVFEISGPGLEEPEVVAEKGKKAAQARVAELTEAYKAKQAADNGGGGAPI
jgi:hypothetical protein